MNNTGINTSVYANVVAPFSPVGKQAIGLENAEAKEEVFPPVEESATTDAATNAEASESEQASQRQGEQRVEERQQKQQELQDQQLIRQLAARDREVRAHEQAHAAVGGQYAGAPSYTFERGPDGVNYAVGGEVPITLPTGGDPRETLAAAEQVQRAALAPANPSAQDRRVAAGAARVAIEARADIVEQQVQEQRVETERVEQARQEDQQSEPIESEPSAPQQAQQGQDVGEQQSAESQQTVRRSAQLGEQLVTLDNIQSNQNIGSVVDQRA